MPSASPNQAAKSFTVLQYNVHMSNSGFNDEARSVLSSQARKIAALSPQPDVICFQELYIPEMQKAYIAAFDDYMPHSALLASPSWCNALRTGAAAEPWLFAGYCRQTTDLANFASACTFSRKEREVAQPD